MKAESIKIRQQCADLQNQKEDAKTAAEESVRQATDKIEKIQKEKTIIEASYDNLLEERDLFQEEMGKPASFCESLEQKLLRPSYLRINFVRSEHLKLYSVQCKPGRAKVRTQCRQKCGFYACQLHF